MSYNLKLQSCFRNMAQILSGKDASSEIRRKLQVEVASYGTKFAPGLTILQARKNHGSACNIF